MALSQAIVERLAEEIEKSGERAAALMLAGGTTPLHAYRSLSTHKLARSGMLSLLFSDERYVPSTCEASNFHSAISLIEALGLPGEQVLRVRTELPLDEAVDDYDCRLRALVNAGMPVRFGILGLGADGHTASLFSEDDLRRAQGKFAVAANRPDGRIAVTVTPEFLRHVTQVVFAVAGADKHPALKALVQGQPESIAARATANCSAVEIWADRDAWPIQSALAFQG
jgi:6-phosphogluconolactonase